MQIDVVLFFVVGAWFIKPTCGEIRKEEMKRG